MAEILGQQAARNIQLEGLKNIKNFLMASIVGFVLVYFGYAISISGVYFLVSVAIIALLLGGLALLVSIFCLNSGLKDLSRTSDEFRTPSKLLNLCKWCLIPGIILLILVILVTPVAREVIGQGPGLQGTAVAQGPQNTGSEVFALLRLIIGLAALTLICVAGLLIIAGAVLGMWLIGERIGSTAIKVGSILYLIPLLQVLGVIIMLIYLPVDPSELVPKASVNSSSTSKKEG